MTPLTAEERDLLDQVAFDVSETLDQDGYTIGLALDQHASFRRSAHPRSSLTRQQVLAAVERSASRAGLTHESVSGGLDLVTWPAPGVERRIRVKSPAVTPDLEYDFVVGENSTVLHPRTDGLMVTEQWLYGYTIDEDTFSIDKQFVAEVLGTRPRRNGDHGPLHLVLGQVIHLGRGLPEGEGFQSDADDSLGGDYDDSQDDETGEGGAAL